MAEPTEPLGRMLNGWDKNNNPITAFVTDTGKRTEAELLQAIDTYNASGKTPKGYKILSAGTSGYQIQEGFEKVAGWLKQRAQDVGGTVGTDLAPTGYVQLGEKLGLMPKGAAQTTAGAGRELGQGVASLLTAPLRSPETALGTAGGLAATAATAGLGPGAVGTLSALPAALSTALGTGLGYGVGGVMTGSGFDAGKAATEALFAGSIQGGLGAFQSIINRGVSQRAQADVKAGIANLLKGELSHVAADPAAIQRYMSTPNGLETIVQMGVKAVRGDASTFVGDLQSIIAKRPPNSMSREAAYEFRDLSRKFVDLTDDLLSDIAARGKPELIRRELNNVHDSILTLMFNEMKGAPSSVKRILMQRVEAKMMEQHDLITKATGTVELLGALKRSGAGAGYNNEAFQKEIAEYFRERPQSLLKQAGEMAYRNTRLAGRTDRPFGSLHIPMVGTQGRGIQTPNLGQRYLGQVQSPAIPMLEHIVGQGGLQSFTGRKQE